MNDVSKVVDYSLVVAYPLESRFVRGYVRNNLGKAVIGERGRGLLCIIWLMVSSLMGPKMNARQQCHVGALGNTLG
jgi:hypothetical protein